MKMRRVCLATLSILVAATVPVHVWNEDAERCYKAGADANLQVQYCTKAIDTGGLTGVDLATTYTNRGNAFRNRGELERALSDYDAALRAVPTHVQAMVARARLYRSEERRVGEAGRGCG